MDVNQKSLTSPSGVQVTDPALSLDAAHEQMGNLVLQNKTRDQEASFGLSGAGALETLSEDSLDQYAVTLKSSSQNNATAQAKKSERTISVAEILKRTKAEKEAKAAIASSNTNVTTQSALPEAFIVETPHFQLASLESSSATISEPAPTPLSSQKATQKKTKTSTQRTKKSQQSAKSKLSVVASSETSVVSGSNLSLAEQIDAVAETSVSKGGYSDPEQVDTNNAECVIAEIGVSKEILDLETSSEEGATLEELHSDIQQTDMQQVENSKEQNTVVQSESKQNIASKHSSVPTANHRQSIHALQQSAAAEGITLDINEDLLNLPDEEICKLGVVDIQGRKNSRQEFCNFSFKDASLGKKVIDIQLNTDDPEQLSKLLPHSNSVSLDKFIESFALYTGRVADPNYTKYSQQIAIIPESDQEYDAYFSRLHNIFLFGQTATIEDFFPNAFKRPAVAKILERYLPYGSVPLKSLYRMHIRFSALSRLEANAESIMNCNIQYPEVEHVSATPLVTSKNQGSLDSSANSMIEQESSPAIAPSLRVEQPTTQYQRQFANLAYESSYSHSAEHGNEGTFLNQAANVGGNTHIEQENNLNQGAYPYQNLNQGSYGNNQLASHSLNDSNQAQAPMRQFTNTSWQQTRNPWQQNNSSAPVLNDASSMARYPSNHEVYALSKKAEERGELYTNHGQQASQKQYTNNGQYVSQANQNPYANQGNLPFHQVSMQHASLGFPNLGAPQVADQSYGQNQSPNFGSHPNPSLNSHSNLNLNQNLNQNGAMVVNQNSSQCFDLSGQSTNLPYRDNNESCLTGNLNATHGAPYVTGNSNVFNGAASINTASNMGGVPPRTNASLGMTSYQPYSVNQNMQQMPYSAQSHIHPSNPNMATEGFSPALANGATKDNITQSNVNSCAPVYVNGQMMQPAYNQATQGAINSNQASSQMPYSTNQCLKQQEFGARYQGTAVSNSQAQSTSNYANSTNRQHTAQWGNQGSNVNRRPSDPHTR